MKKALISPVIFPTLLPLILTAACAKGPDASRNWEPPAPCYKGLNTTGCGPEIQDGSAWKNEVTFKFNSDLPTEVTKTISVYYEFGRRGDQQTWQRVVTVDSSDHKGKRAMFESGLIVPSIASAADVNSKNSQHLDLIMNSNSCADEMQSLTDSPLPLTIYFDRRGNEIEISNLPFVPYEPTGSGIGAVLGDAIGQALNRGIKYSLNGLFTFGSARRWLESNSGFLKKSNRIEAKDAGIIGCFTSVGNGFKPLAMPATDPGLNTDSSSPLSANRRNKIF